MSLYAVLIAGVLWGMSAGAAYLYGVNVGDDRCVARQAREDDVRRQTREDAQLGAAAAISANKPRNVTIRQETEREIRTNTFYAECRHSAEQLRRLNEALTGIRAEPAGGGQLPAARAPE